MTSEITIVFAILGIVITLFVSNKFPVGVIAIGATLALWGSGILSLEQALSGFADQTVLFIAGLFVVSEGLDSAGVTGWAGHQLVAFAGESKTRLIISMMVLCAILTMVISVNGAIAALMPVVVVTAVRLKYSPSKLLLPLVFASHAGSMLALTGTPVHPLISEAAIEVGAHGFGYFEFAYAGIPLFLGTIAIVVLFGDRLIPERTPKSIPANLSHHARTLVDYYGLGNDAHHLSITSASSLVGLPRASLNFDAYPEVELIAVSSDSREAPGERLLIPGDVLLLRGLRESIQKFAKKYALRLAEAEADVSDTLFSAATGLAEVIVPPRSPLIGVEVFPSMVTESGDLVILAVRRRNSNLETGRIILEAGDLLLLQGSWTAFDEHLGDSEVLVVDSTEAIRRQSIPLGKDAKKALIILGTMIIALATGVVPPVVASLISACAMIALRILSPEHAYRGISWTTVILVAGMIPLSLAMVETGAADLVAKQLVTVVGPWGPYAFLAGIFLLTAFLGQLISNMATALIVIPIALSAALELGFSPRAVLMTLTIAAGASFLTPVATPVNMMIMEPAGYKFGDYWRLGLTLMALFFVVAVFLVPLIWPL